MRKTFEVKSTSFMPENKTTETLNYYSWDYNAYGTCCDRYNYCKPRKKLYSDSYCNITCNSSNFIMNIDVPDYQAIVAMKINETENCSTECYGLFKGYNC